MSTIFPALLLLAIITSCSVRAAVVKKQPHKKVLILGAGLTGIIAGKTLMDNGVSDFLILEGQDYIGGRIKQHSFAGYKIEEGANWIQSAYERTSQHIWKLKEAMNLTGLWTKYTYSDLVIRNETGANITDKANFDGWDKVENNYESLQNEREKNEKPAISLREGLALLGWNPKNTADKALEYLNTEYEFAVPPEKVPFSEFSVMGDDFFVTDPRGMISLFKPIYDKFEDKILLNKNVTHVKYDSKSVEVTTSNGEVYTADYGLCTFSTGVLASDLVTFTPPLPEWKRQAIFKKPMAVYTKIFLKFPSKFWDNKEHILLASDKKGFFPTLQDLSKPGKFPGSSTLLVTVTDDEGRRIEKQSFEKTKEEIVTMLRGVYGQGIPEPTGNKTDIFYPRWSTNPFIQGAYTYVPLNTTSEDVEKLGKNIGNLYFAGEGTSVYWSGHLQGAYWTGLLKARTIVAATRSDSVITEGKLGVTFLCLLVMLVVH